MANDVHCTSPTPFASWCKPRKIQPSDRCSTRPPQCRQNVLTLSVIFQSCIVQFAKFQSASVCHFPVSTFSTSAIWCITFQVRHLHLLLYGPSFSSFAIYCLCYLVHRFPGSSFTPPAIWSVVLRSWILHLQRPFLSLETPPHIRMWYKDSY